MKWYKLNAKYLLYYFILSLLSLLYIFPIILANLYYKDDLGWSLNGSIGLKGDGRPLGEYLVLLLCGGAPVTDTAPLSLILSVLFLSYALVLYARTNLDAVSDNYLLIPILLSVLTNPLSVECLTYRYGSFVMFTALGIPFVIYSIPETVSRVKLFIYSAFLSIAFMSLYQTAAGMCLILLILAVFLEIVNKNKPLSSAFFIREGIRIAGVGVGAVFYQLIIARRYIQQLDWRYDASQTLPLSLSSIKTIFEHIIAACSYVMDFISGTALWYQLVLVFTIVTAIAVMLFFYCRETEQKGKYRIFGIVFLLLSPALVFVAGFFPIMLLQSLMLKTRTFIALGGVLLYLGIFMLYQEKKHKTFVPVLLVLCILYHFTYIYAYGSALTRQNEYAKYLVYNIANDLETLNADGTYTSVSFVGEMPKNRQMQMLYDKYPIYDSILPTYFTNNSWMGGAWVLQYLQDDLNIDSEPEADAQIVSTTAPVISNASYSCYVNSDKIIVAFH